MFFKRGHGSHTGVENNKIQPRPEGLLAFQYGAAVILESEKTLGTRLGGHVGVPKWSCVD